MIKLNRKFLMKKLVIKKIYNNKIKEFNKHNELYYSKDKPLILDNEYDQLKKYIRFRKNIVLNIKIPHQNYYYKPSKIF